MYPKPDPTHTTTAPDTDGDPATERARRRRRHLDDAGHSRHAYDDGGRRPRSGRGGRSGGRGRARRGDVRAAILAVLADTPMHGYEIMTELAERTGGIWRPSPGSVYPTLQMLEEQGLVTGEDADGTRRYTLTAAGQAEVDAQSGPAPWDRVTHGADPDVVKLRDAMSQTAAAVKQVGVAGTDDQKRRVAELLTATRKAIYTILAEDA